MREKTENWLCEMFAADISVGPAEGSLLEPERRRDYRLWVVSGLTVEFLLVTPRPGVRNPSVLGIAELVHSVRERSVRWVAYGTGALSAVERKRLLVRHVPFVVAGRQVFLPFLGIALRADSSALARSCLSRAAQHFMLEYLEGHTGPFDNQFVYRKIKCSCASAYRAYGELEAFGLIDRTPQGIVFRPNAKHTFRLLLPRLKRSPYRDALIAAIYGETGAHTGLSQRTGLTTV